MGLLPEEFDDTHPDRGDEVWRHRIPFLLDPEGNSMVGKPGDWHCDFDVNEIRATFGLGPDQDPWQKTSSFRGFAIAGLPDADVSIHWPPVFQGVRSSAEPDQATKQKIHDAVRASYGKRCAEEG